MEKATIYSHEVGKVLPMKLRYWPRWSLGHRCANFIFASGQPGVDNRGVVRAPGNAGQQARDALENLRRIIEAGGGWFEDVFAVRVFVNFAEDASAVVASVATYLRERFPQGDWPVLSYAISPVGATRDRSLLLVEIEAFAATARTAIRSGALFLGIADCYPTDNYRHVVRVGNLAFTAGFLGIDRRGRLLSDDPAQQADAAFRNLELALDAAHLGPSDIVKLTIFADDSGSLKAAQDVCRSFLRNSFGDVGPAMTTMFLPLPVPGAAFAVQAVAASGPRELVRTDDVYSGEIVGAPYAQAVRVPLSSPEGSFLRRFTWPSHPSDVERASLGAELEREQSLGQLVFLSSQAPLDAAGSVVTEGDVTRQTAQVFENIGRICDAAGGAFSDVLQVDIYVDSADNYPAFNEARVSFTEAHYPDKNWFCGSGVTGRSRIDGAHVEIESIAAVA
jgi:enamine deaminase RidA (YjgF/YER057c/UK114 family)